MQTKDKKGIECDLCGAIYKHSFTYYSCDATRVDVNIEGGSTDIEKRHLNMDWCSGCMDKFKEYMLKVIDIREGRRKKDDSIGAGEWSLES